MKNNYVIQAEINVAKHPEWNIEERFIEFKRAYEKEGYRCHLMDNTMLLIPSQTSSDIKGLKSQLFIIDEGGV